MEQDNKHKSPFAIGVIMPGNKEQKEKNDITSKWIKDNVKKEHQSMITNFTKNPHLHNGLIDWSEVLIFGKNKINFNNKDSSTRSNFKKENDDLETKL